MTGLGRRLRELGLAAASVAVLLLALLGAELGIRAFGSPGPDAAVDLARLHRFSPTLGWEPRPLARYCEAGHCATINASGYRGDPVDEAAGGPPRVLMLGDSITFGLDVGDDQTFSRLLGRDFNLAVLNFAVQGYGPDQSLLRFEEQGLQKHPRAVVMNFCLDNDFADTALATFLFGPQPKPYFELRDSRLVKHDEHLRLSALARTGLWVQERSYLFRRAQAFAARWSGRSALPWYERKKLVLADREPRIATTFAILALLRERAEAAGARFLLVVHPTGPAYREGSVWLDAFAASPRLAGIRILSLRETYRPRGLAWRDISVDPIGHLTPLGHRLAAEDIGKALTELLREEAASEAGGAAALREAPQQVGLGLDVRGRASAHPGQVAHVAHQVAGVLR